MNDRYILDRLSEGEPRCGFERTLKGEYCGEKGDVSLGSLRLCERHAERLRLEERVAYWRALVAHIRLWSGEAHRGSRGDVVELLEAEEERASSALERASSALRRHMEGAASGMARKARTVRTK